MGGLKNLPIVLFRSGGISLGKTLDFRQKEVINMQDGRRLGFISDVDVDFNSGVIRAIVLPGGGKFLGFLGGGDEIIIPWDNIVKIGVDTILVKFEIPKSLK